MSQRDRVSAAAWLVVRDAHTAEDIFQNVALKAMTKGTQFESGGVLMSWAFITARREGIDMPIVAAVRRLLEGAAPAGEVVADILSRPLRSEQERLG